MKAIQLLEIIRLLDEANMLYEDALQALKEGEDCSLLSQLLRLRALEKRATAKKLEIELLLQV